MVQSQTYTIPFISKKEIAKDTFSFYFSRPKEFEFIAGQYNRWILPINATDGRGASRFFTISSSPNEKDFISLTTKIIQSDFKKSLLQLKEKDEIKIFGPMGQFTLDENDTRQQVFIAGGIGITPFHSIISDVAAKNISIPIILLVSFSLPEEVIFFSELTEIAKTHDNIKIVYTVTHPKESQLSWTGETGRISREMIEKYVKNVKNIPQSVFYVVGPPPMVEGTEKLLEGMGITPSNIKTEQFSGY